MKINIHSPIGDPANPKTWSGTPFHIVNELKKENSLGEIYYPGSYNMLEKVVYKTLYTLHSKKILKDVFGLISWGNLRTYTASVLARKQRATKHKNTLHFGTLGLPFAKPPANHRQYLYTDGVWSLWSKYSPLAQKLSAAQVQQINDLEKQSYLQMTHIFSVSSYVKRELINQYGVQPDKISVVGTGSGTIKPFMGKKDYTNGCILFVAKGRFEEKGGYIVLKAFEKALTINTELHLSIVGQNDYAHLIKHPRITTYGYVSDKELQGIFESHSLFFMPALNEPWGLVYIEAMLSKMPILGLNRNSFPELSQNGKFGKGFDEPDTDLFAHAICDFFLAPAEMEVMGNAAQNYANQKFSWQKTCDSIVSTIKQMDENES